MNCPKCNRQIGNVKYCSYCGAKIDSIKLKYQASKTLLKQNVNFDEQIVPNDNNQQFRSIVSRPKNDSTSIQTPLENCSQKCDDYKASSVISDNIAPQETESDSQPFEILKSEESNTTLDEYVNVEVSNSETIEESEDGERESDVPSDFSRLTDSFENLGFEKPIAVSNEDLDAENNFSETMGEIEDAKKESDVPFDLTGFTDRFIEIESEKTIAISDENSGDENNDLENTEESKVTENENDVPFDLSGFTDNSKGLEHGELFATSDDALGTEIDSTEAMGDIDETEKENEGDIPFDLSSFTDSSKKIDLDEPVAVLDENSCAENNDLETTEESEVTENENDVSFDPSNFTDSPEDPVVTIDEELGDKVNNSETAQVGKETEQEGGSFFESSYKEDSDNAEHVPALSKESYANNIQTTIDNQQKPPSISITDIDPMFGEPPSFDIDRIKENYSQHQNNINKKTKKQKSKKHIK